VGEFAEFLSANGIIDECAVFDAEGYDGGAMMARVSKAWQAATDNAKAQALAAQGDVQTHADGHAASQPAAPG
jgi:hypothetical protein